MKKIDKPFTFDFTVFFSCVYFWCYIYCVFTLVLEFISLSIYVGIVLFAIIISSYLFVWYVALPKPDNALVKEILGSDPKLIKRNSSLTSSLTSHNSAGNEGQILDDEEFFTVIGHRGAGLDAPENSLSAFKQCHEKGFRAVEFDLVLTADDVPVLFHDDTVDRLTNATGIVQQMTWEQLKALDISEKHPLQQRYVGERVALFSETVKLCLELDMRMIIDVKDESAKMVQVILDTFTEFPKLYKRAMVSGFNPIIIYMLRSRDPRIVCSLAWRPHYHALHSYGRDSGKERRYSSLPAHLAASLLDVASTWLLHHLGYYVLGLSAILLHKDMVTSDVVSLWDKRNVRVIVWTVNRPQEKQYFSRVLRVAYITDTLASEPFY